MKRIVAVNCSPRSGWNTAALVQKAAAALKRRAHLYVANEETFRFCRADQTADLPGYSYIGSVNL